MLDSLFKRNTPPGEAAVAKPAAQAPAVPDGLLEQPMAHTPNGPQYKVVPWWEDVERFINSRGRTQMAPLGHNGQHLEKFVFSDDIAAAHRHLQSLAAQWRNPLPAAALEHAGYLLRSHSHGCAISGFLFVLFAMAGVPLLPLGLVSVTALAWRAQKLSRVRRAPSRGGQLQLPAGSPDPAAPARQERLENALPNLPEFGDIWMLSCWRLGRIAAGYNARVEAINASVADRGAEPDELRAAAGSAGHLIKYHPLLMQVQRKLEDGLAKRRHVGQSLASRNAELAGLDPFGDQDPVAPGLDWLILPDGYLLRPTDLPRQYRADLEAIDVQHDVDVCPVDSAIRALEGEAIGGERLSDGVPTDQPALRVVSKA